MLLFNTNLLLDDPAAFALIMAAVVIPLVASVTIHRSLELD